MKILKIVFVLLLFFCFFIQPNSANEITIFFYNPDAAPNDPTTLIKAATDYFKKINQNIKVQPVIDVEVFVNLIKDKKARVFIAPEGLIKTLGGDVKVIMSPENDKNTNAYNKLLLVKENTAASVEELSGANIGTTSMGSESLSLLNEYLFSSANFDVNKSKVIWVKKDLDAVLATKFGQMKAAIISEKNWSKIESVNPAALKGVTILLKSKEIPEAPLAVASDLSQAEIDILVSAFSDMDKSPEGQAFLKILGYSKWLKK